MANARQRGGSGRGERIGSGGWTGQRAAPQRMGIGQCASFGKQGGPRTVGVVNDDDYKPFPYPPRNSSLSTTPIHLVHLTSPLPTTANSSSPASLLQHPLQHHDGVYGTRRALRKLSFAGGVVSTSTRVGYEEETEKRRTGVHCPARNPSSEGDDDDDAVQWNETVSVEKSEENTANTYRRTSGRRWKLRAGERGLQEKSERRMLLVERTRRRWEQQRQRQRRGRRRRRTPERGEGECERGREWEEEGERKCDSSLLLLVPSSSPLYTSQRRSVHDV
ncbi:hypothetical protein SCHPADRAFT_1003475 [Schizopora paradoxa]|uniref:Uncharacterized protein n=1 Tax=Schizopora paradoxa TaxID=27342 RepID=A0A0H2QW27_9AGAM|nr:hypothetical protein SCHPADRAFT_1003475 [Schizopora paradoxa]